MSKTHAKKTNLTSDQNNKFWSFKHWLRIATKLMLFVEISVMTDQINTFWPFKRWLSVATTLILLIWVFLIADTIEIPNKINNLFDGSNSLILTGILVLCLLPIILAVVDVMIERGAVIKYGSLKIDFSQAPPLGMSGIDMPENLGVPGQYSDQSPPQIFKALKSATACDLVIVDLKDGNEWWETRLLVLLAGAVRLRKPEKVVFVGKQGDTDRCFKAWSYASELLPRLLETNKEYPRIYHAALAAARQWDQVEPAIGEEEPPGADRVQGRLAKKAHEWAFYKNKLPNTLLAEQLLASELR